MDESQPSNVAKCQSQIGRPRKLENMAREKATREAGEFVQLFLEEQVLMS
jgi:hypothetical protein